MMNNQGQGKKQSGNAQGFKAPLFARLEDLQIRVKLLPLLSRKVEADVVKVRGLTVNLERKKDGQTNWEDLIKAEPPKKPEQQGEGKESLGAAEKAISRFHFYMSSGYNNYFRS